MPSNMRILGNIILVTGIFLALSTETKSANDLPYKGRAIGKVVKQNFICNPVVGGEPFLSERGEAKGKFTGVGDAKVDLEWVVSLNTEGEEMVYVLVGWFRITASDGSVMNGIFTSVQNCQSTQNRVEVNVINGTGRFTGVTGLIPGKGVRNGNDFSYDLDGLIWIVQGK
jgi:hypothetical protein